MIANIRRRVPRRARPKAGMFHLPKSSYSKISLSDGPLGFELHIALMPPYSVGAFVEMYDARTVDSGWYSYRWGPITVFFKLLVRLRSSAPSAVGRGVAR